MSFPVPDHPISEDEMRKIRELIDQLDDEPFRTAVVYCPFCGEGHKLIRRRWDRYQCRACGARFVARFNRRVKVDG